MSQMSTAFQSFFFLFWALLMALHKFQTFNQYLNFFIVECQIKDIINLIPTITRTL